MINKGFNENVRKLILNIILNFGTENTIDLIYQNLESKIPKKMIKTYIYLFQTNLFYAYEGEFDLYFFFFDECPKILMRNIQAINKMNRFLRDTKEEQQKTIDKIISEGKLTNNEKMKQIIYSIINMIIKKGGKFYF